MPRLYGFKVSNASFLSYFNFVDNLCTLIITMVAVVCYDKPLIQPVEPEKKQIDQKWAIAVILNNMGIFLLVIFASLFIQLRGFQKKFRIIRMAIEIPSLAGLYYFYQKYKITQDRYGKEGGFDQVMNLMGKLIDDPKDIQQKLQYFIILLYIVAGAYAFRLIHVFALQFGNLEKRKRTFVNELAN